MTTPHSERRHAPSAPPTMLMPTQPLRRQDLPHHPARRDHTDPQVRRLHTQPHHHMRPPQDKELQRGQAHSLRRWSPTMPGYLSPPGLPSVPCRATTSPLPCTLRPPLHPLHPPLLRHYTTPTPEIRPTPRRNERHGPKISLELRSASAWTACSWTTAARHEQSDHCERCICVWPATTPPSGPRST